jgi:phage-related minor tail protein
MAADQFQRDYDYYMKVWQDQQKYHSKKASMFKRNHQILQVVIAVGAVLVPILLGIQGVSPIIPTILSAAVAIATAWENIFKNGDNWRSNRQTSELLKREFRMLKTRSAAYKTADDPFDLFVTNVETILSEQNQMFATINKSEINAAGTQP